MVLSCEASRRLLWPLGRPRELGAAEAAARLHLDGCTSCRAFFARDNLLTALLGRYGGRARAPAALRSRVRRALAREAPRP